MLLTFCSSAMRTACNLCLMNSTISLKKTNQSLQMTMDGLVRDFLGGTMPFVLMSARLLRALPGALHCSSRATDMLHVTEVP